MTFVRAVQVCLTKYAKLSGRASRSEFWWFQLFAALVGVAIDLAMEIIAIESGSTAVSVIRHMVSFALFIPAFAVGARRLHDIGRSGRWECLMFTVIGFVPLIIWWIWPGDEAENCYGPPAA